MCIRILEFCFETAIKNMLTILTNPNPILHEISKPVEPTEISRPEFQKFLDEMIETIKEAGLGLAAPQVGVNKRFIIVKIKNGFEPFINPEIVSVSWRKADSEEGCLSVPGVWGIVRRRAKVRVKALNRRGEKIKIKAKGLEAFIFQHELDHLDGILFIDKVRRFIKIDRM